MKKPFSFLILTSLTFPLIVGSAKAEIVIQSGTTMQPTFNSSLPTGVNNVSGTTAPTNIIFTQDRNCKTDGELSNYQSILLQACINEIVDELDTTSSNITTNTSNINRLGEGIAGSTALTAALTALPQMSKESKATCGVGTGAYSSRYAVGFGCASKVSKRIDVNAGG